MPVPSPRRPFQADADDRPPQRFSRAWWGRPYERIRHRLSEPEHRVGTAVALAAAGLLAAGLIVALALYAFSPSAQELEQARFAEATIAYTADGEELTRYHDKNRVWIPLDSVSQHVVNALVATEDHRFFRHRGIDVRRLGGSALKTLGGDPQGGSTITMQLARNAFPEIHDDPVLVRKGKEWITALSMEDRFGKRELLEMYLNTVPFMYNAFGIEAGARTYFQKPASNLTVLEAATLVGMLKGTVYYNPVRNPERSQTRRNTVLDNMVKHGYLSATERDSLRARETPLRFQRMTRETGLAPYFAEHVRQWLNEWADENGYNLYTDGLRVYTTLDSRLQAAAEEAAQTTADELQAVADVEWSQASIPFSSGNGAVYQRARQRVQPFAHFWARNEGFLNQVAQRSGIYRQLVEDGLPEDSALVRVRADAALMDSLKREQQRLNVGFVALDPERGHIKAWVGGRDFEVSEFDHVAQAKRQPGSTFKPFVYLTALERGFRPTSRLRDEVVEYRDPDTRRVWRPTNVGRATGEMMTLAEALAQSKNTITAQLVTEVGPSRVASTAQRAGIESELDAVPALGLGTGEVTLLELATAYATLAQGGRYRKPIPVTRIENRAGRVIATFAPSMRSTLSEYASYDVLDMMRGVVDSGTGVRIRNQYGARGDLAGKTGTSQNGADGWFMLMHPDLVMGAWVGFTSPRVHFRSSYWGQGAHTALHVVGRFHRQARQASGLLSTDRQYQPPAGYTPPTPPEPDTLDAYFARLDSMAAAESDSLLQRVDASLARTDSLLRRAVQRDTIARGAPNVDEPQPVTPDEPLSPADSLNRLERQKELEVTRRPARRSTPDSSQTGEPNRQRGAGALDRKAP